MNTWHEDDGRDDGRDERDVQPAPAKVRADREWTFPRHFPKTHGKRIAMRYPTSAEERDIRIAMDSSFAGEMMKSTTGKDKGETRREHAVDAKIRVAQDCIVSFDGRPLRDDERQDVWDLELDGGARDECIQWVSHWMSPSDPDADEEDDGRPTFLR